MTFLIDDLVVDQNSFVGKVTGFTSDVSRVWVTYDGYSKAVQIDANKLHVLTQSRTKRGSSARATGRRANQGCTSVTKEPCAIRQINIDSVTGKRLRASPKRLFATESIQSSCTKREDQMRYKEASDDKKQRELDDKNCSPVKEDDDTQIDADSFHNSTTSSLGTEGSSLRVTGGCASVTQGSCALQQINVISGRGKRLRASPKRFSPDSIQSSSKRKRREDQMKYKEAFDDDSLTDDDSDDKSYSPVNEDDNTQTDADSFHYSTTSSLGEEGSRPRVTAGKTNVTQGCASVTHGSCAIRQINIISGEGKRLRASPKRFSPDSIQFSSKRKCREDQLRYSINTPVAKTFPADEAPDELLWYRGYVQEEFKVNGSYLYKIRYEDDDSEDVDQEELKEIAANFTEGVLDGPYCYSKFSQPSKDGEDKINNAKKAHDDEEASEDVGVLEDSKKNDTIQSGHFVYSENEGDENDSNRSRQFVYSEDECNESDSNLSKKEKEFVYSDDEGNGNDSNRGRQEEEFVYSEDESNDNDSNGCREEEEFVYSEDEGNENDSNGCIPEEEHVEADKISDDQALLEMKRKHDSDIRLFEYMDMVQFQEESQDSSPVALHVEFDADSFGFVTDDLSEVGCLNLTGMEFHKASVGRSPLSVRPMIKGSREFLILNEDGTQKKTPTSLQKFPCFNVGTLQFRGLPVYLSIHILQPGKVGQSCELSIIETWNAVNNWALRNFSEEQILALGEVGLVDSTDNDYDQDSFDDENEPELANMNAARGDIFRATVHDYCRAASSMYELGTNSGREGTKVKFHGNFTPLLHLDLVWYKLRRLAHAREELENADNNAAFQLYQNSVFLLQHAGLKQRWRQDLRPDSDNFSVCNICPHRYPREYNEWLQQGVKETYKSARELFIKDQAMFRRSSSHFAIDIGITFECTADYHVIPLGKIAEITVQRATKQRYGYGGTQTDSQEEDGAEVEEQYWGSDDESSSDASDTTTDDLNLRNFIEEAVGSSSAKQRTTYPQLQTAGKFGNAQSKFKIMDMKVVVSRDGEREIFEVEVDHGNHRRAAPFVQMYQPNTKYLTPPKGSMLRKEAAKLPLTIMRMASEFEQTLIPTRALKKEQEQFCKVVKALLRKGKEFCSALMTQNFHVRYEMTFQAAPWENPDEIQPPITNTISPINGLAFVKKQDLQAKMTAIIGMHNTVLGKLCNAIETHPEVLRTIIPSQWAACVAQAESLGLLFGIKGGGRGTLMKSSIDNMGPFYYDSHFWIVPPKFLRLPAGGDGNMPAQGLQLPFEVDPTLLRLSDLNQPNDSANGSTRMERASALMEEKTASAFLNGLPKLKHQSAVRTTCSLMYSSFLKAGREEPLDTNEVSGTKFDAVTWENIGRDVESTQQLFADLAELLLAYHKFEASNRLVKNLRKKLRSHTRGGNQAPNTLTQAGWLKIAKDLGNATSLSECTEWKENLQATLGVEVPNSTCQISKVSGKLKSAADIFGKMTGQQLDEIDAEIQYENKQGWATAGYGFILQYLKSQFQKVKHPSAATLACYHGQNPFHRWKTFQHYLAVSVVSLQGEDSPTFLWHTMPSKLDPSWKIHEVAYEVQLGSVSSTLPPQSNEAHLSPQHIATDQIYFDNFRELFFSVPKGQHRNHLYYKTPIHFNDVPKRNSKPIEIFLLQAAIFWLCQHHDVAAKEQKVNVNSLRNIGITQQLFPSGIKGDDSIRRTYGKAMFIPMKNFSTHLMKERESWNYHDLYQALNATSKVDPYLFSLAVKQLKPPLAIKNAASLCDAWVDLDDSSNRKLALQKEALRTQRYATAVYIYSCYGLASKELFQHITMLRDKVREHTWKVRTTNTAEEKEKAENDAKLDLLKYKLFPSTGARFFNFDPP